MVIWQLRLFLNTARRLVWWKALRMIRPRRWPHNSDGSVRIHLGCGPIDAPGYINVDLIPYPHVHYIGLAAPLEMFAGNQADLIYASHMLEHLTRVAADIAVREWHRILKPGGVLRLGVPDFGKLVEIYRKTGSVEDFEGILMGMQTYEAAFHQSVYDEARLRSLLLGTGFREVRPWSPETAPHHDFRDTTSYEAVIRGERYPISLNLEAVK